MNFRAIALGAAVCTLALFSACGTKANTNTDGGTSTADAGSGGGTGGGTGGSTGQTCKQQGKCTKPDGSCGDSCKVGCCIAGDAAGRCQTALSDSLCGKGGEVCSACGTGTKCQAASGGSTCGTGPTGTVGSACSTGNDCAGITVDATAAQYGVVAQCKTSALDFAASDGTGIAYPDGYCTMRCWSNAQCGSGNTCAFYLGALGEYENTCFKTCGTDSDCRTGYFCLNQVDGLPLFTSGGICFPGTAATTHIRDAGMGFAGEAGAACTSDTQCQPPETGGCITETLADGGMTGYVGGACTAECGGALLSDADGTWCGTKGACTPQLQRTQSGGPVVVWLCERACGVYTDTQSGQTTDYGACRTGYTCDNSTNQCRPTCSNAGVTCGTGYACQTTGTYAGLCCDSAASPLTADDCY